MIMRSIAMKRIRGEGVVRHESARLRRFVRPEKNSGRCAVGATRFRQRANLERIRKRGAKKDAPRVGDIEYAVVRFRKILDGGLPLTLETNAAAMRLARDHRLSFYYALIVASVLEAGCDTLYSEDMQDGRVIQRLSIRNPFRQDQP